jgi:hypothetical protein
MVIKLTTFIWVVIATGVCVTLYGYVSSGLAILLCGIILLIGDRWASK